LIYAFYNEIEDGLAPLTEEQDPPRAGCQKYHHGEVQFKTVWGSKKRD